MAKSLEEEQRKEIQQILSSGAFAALKRNGSVITRGNQDFGGDSGLMKEQLSKLEQFVSVDNAHAALKSARFFVERPAPAPEPSLSDGQRPAGRQAGIFRRTGLHGKGRVARGQEVEPVGSL